MLLSKSIHVGGTGQENTLVAYDCDTLDHPVFGEYGNAQCRVVGLPVMFDGT
ncbi:hypothetical protein C349_04031 [Cryptococcus neoformans var. grubii Br795]|nr:hypothetical protein C349_04031 [Cryptococcus neoformans var. grubii Br795]